MKLLVVLGLILAISSATPIEQDDKVEVKLTLFELLFRICAFIWFVSWFSTVRCYIFSFVWWRFIQKLTLVSTPEKDEPSVENRQVISNLANLVGAANVADLTAIIQQLVREELKNILANLQTAQNLTATTLSGLINADESDSEKLQVVVKQEVEKQAEQPAEAKPVYFLPRRPGYFPPHHPMYYGPQQAVPYYNEEPYFYRGGPQWRRINPTDESLSDMDALAELELLLNEKGEMSSEARGLMSSLSSTTNSAKASFKSFVNSLSSALPSFSIVRKTYLVPGLAING